MCKNKLYKNILQTYGNCATYFTVHYRSQVVGLKRSLQILVKCCEILSEFHITNIESILMESILFYGLMRLMAKFYVYKVWHKISRYETSRNFAICVCTFVEIPYREISFQTVPTVYRYRSNYKNLSSLEFLCFYGVPVDNWLI
jgi:hypothetical protein